MAEKEKASGILGLGLVIGFILGIVCLGVISVKCPEQMRGTDKLLNSGKYKIDTTTTITISNYDTIKTTKCKFVKMQEHEI